MKPINGAGKPSKKWFVVIVYDISDNKRRTRLHKLLKHFGEPVQYSAFEAILTNEQLQRMKHSVGALVEKGDKVRFYYLCEGCQKRIEGTKGHPTARDAASIII